MSETTHDETTHSDAAPEGAADEGSPTVEPGDTTPDVAEATTTGSDDPTVGSVEDALSDAETDGSTTAGAEASGSVEDSTPAEEATGAVHDSPDVDETDVASPDLEPEPSRLQDDGGDEDTQDADEVSDEADFDAGEGSEDDEAASSRPRGRSRRAPSREQLEKEGEVAADFLETLLDICDLDGDIDVDIDGDRAAVSIVDSEDGRVPRRLVGTNGKVLDALQELTRLAVYASTGDRSRLILDVAGHRSDRRTVLIEIARVAIASVKETGAQQALDPMTPFERKIIHDEVLVAGLRSESDGVEPQRYVVVHPV